MKYITSALVLLALTSQVEQVDAIKINAKFTDDLVKSLAEEMQKDIEEPAAAEAAPAKPALAAKAAAKPAAKTAAKPAAKDAAKPAAKVAAKPIAVVQKAHKKEEEEIPMDAAAIKAYSSVIADAAEDSEPSVPVQYSQVVEQEEVHRDHEILGADPIGSMVQNEIGSIKLATIKATEE